MGPSLLMLPPPRPPELVLVLDFTDASLAFFGDMASCEIVDAVSTPFEYAMSMVPHWVWIDLSLRVIFDLLSLHRAYLQGESDVTYEKLIELTNHPDVKATIYSYTDDPTKRLYYHPTFTFNVDNLKQSMDEIVVNDLEEVLLESLRQDGVDIDQPNFRLYTTSELSSRPVFTDVAIWRFLMTVFTQVVRAVQGIGREYGLHGEALARYNDFMPAKPIHGGESEYLYAVTIREEPW